MPTEHRSQLLGDTGASSPECWQWGRVGQPLNAMLLLYARDKDGLATVRRRYERNFEQHGIGAELLSTTWFENKKEHFGFHDGITTPIIEGLGREAEPALYIKPGSHPGLPNEYHRYPADPLVHRALIPEGHL